MNSWFSGFLALHSSISLCYSILALCSCNFVFLFTSSRPVSCRWTLHISTFLPLKLSSWLKIFLQNCGFPANLSINISFAEILAKCLRRTKLCLLCIISSVLCLLVVLLSLIVSMVKLSPLLSFCRV